MSRYIKIITRVPPRNIQKPIPIKQIIIENVSAAAGRELVHKTMDAVSEYEKKRENIIRKESIDNTDNIVNTDYREYWTEDYDD